jgi:hypothetical protein
MLARRGADNYLILILDPESNLDPILFSDPPWISKEFRTRTDQDLVWATWSEAKIISQLHLEHGENSVRSRIRILFSDPPWISKEFRTRTDQDLVWATWSEAKISPSFTWNMAKTVSQVPGEESTRCLEQGEDFVRSIPAARRRLYPRYTRSVAKTVS